MPAVNFCHGEPIMADYTAAAAVTAGDVIVTTDTPRIAHRDIALGGLGALAVGGGVYTCTANAAIVADKWVYWDSATGKVSTTAGALKRFGRTITAAAADGDVIQVLHQPTP